MQWLKVPGRAGSSWCRPIATFAQPRALIGPSRPRPAPPLAGLSEQRTLSPRSPSSAKPVRELQGPGRPQLPCPAAGRVGVRSGGDRGSAGTLSVGFGAGEGKSWVWSKDPTTPTALGEPVSIPCPFHPSLLSLKSNAHINCKY